MRLSERIAVLVIELGHELAVHIQPRKPMREVVLAVNPDLDISIGSHGSGDAASALFLLRDTRHRNSPFLGS